MAIISKKMRIEMGGASGILMSIFFDESGKIDKSNLNSSIIDIFETFHIGWDYENRLQSTLKHFDKWQNVQ